MKKLQPVLAGLFLVQLMIAGGLYWQEQRNDSSVTAEPLMSFDTSNAIDKPVLDKLVITDGKDTLGLQKIGDQWRLAGFEDLPLANNKLTEILAKLEAAKVNWPVATSTSSHERFEVSDEKFLRKLEFFTGVKKLGELLLGTSPGFRKVHVRRGGEDEVYYVELNAYDLAVTHLDWLDKSLLAAQDIQQINGPDYQLEKSGEHWTFVNASTSQQEKNQDEVTLDEQMKVDNKKAGELANALGNLQFTGIADELPESQGVVIGVKDKAAERRYEFIKEGNKFYVKRDDQVRAFEISQYDYDRITHIRQLELVSQGDTTENEKAADNQKQSNG